MWLTGAQGAAPADTSRDILMGFRAGRQTYKHIAARSVMADPGASQTEQGLVPRVTAGSSTAWYCLCCQGRSKLVPPIPPGLYCLRHVPLMAPSTAFRLASPVPPSDELFAAPQTLDQTAAHSYRHTSGPTLHRQQAAGEAGGSAEWPTPFPHQNVRIDGSERKQRAIMGGPGRGMSRAADRGAAFEIVGC